MTSGIQCVELNKKLHNWLPNGTRFIAVPVKATGDSCEWKPPGNIGYNTRGLDITHLLSPI